MMTQADHPYDFVLITNNRKTNYEARVHTQFFNWAIFLNYYRQVRLHQVRPVPKSKLLGLLWQNFYRPDALPVAQPTASKYEKMTLFLTWRQHAAAVPPC